MTACLKKQTNKQKCVTTTTYQRCRDQFFFLTEKMVDRQTITVDGFTGQTENFQVQVYHYYKLNWVQLE